MKKISGLLLGSSIAVLCPGMLNAAGTYYTGNYQSVQQPYSARQYSSYSSYSSNRYTPSGYSSYTNSNPRYYAPGAYTTNNSAQNQVNKNTSNTSQNSQKKSGFYMDAGISHEFSTWQFDMNESGSMLHYDNVSWNVLDVNAGYGFELGKATMFLDAGFKYGMQSGETKMIDDDITNGGYFITQWVDGSSHEVIGNQIGHALSIGTSQGGSMMGFNVGLGFSDIFKIGNMKITPSVGYRYFSYKLTTEKNYGLSVDTSACFQIDGSDEIQCDPAIIIHYSDGTQQIIWRDSATGNMEIGSGATVVDTQGTYYFQQPGVSHSYETTWAGPYVALDMDYDINQNNAVNGHLEIGLPGYSSVGDQPYRFDWAHPKSVEDEAGMGSALHLGLGANWSTAITDSVMLSVGLTYDYYSVSDADAKTYLNSGYYNDLYNTILNSDKWNGNETAMLDPETGDPIAINIKNLESQCPGWVCSTSGEINSFYKSLGIRVGLQAKF